jgi:hypothetical protein
MPRRLLLVLVAVLAVACNDDDPLTPTAPDPIVVQPAPLPATPRAFFQPVGPFSWNNCVAVLNPFCNFSASLRNTGTGCAIRLEGTIRFFDSFGFQLGSTYRFQFPAQQVIQPGEIVTIGVPFVQLQVAQPTTEYAVAPVWIDTPCR